MEKPLTTAEAATRLGVHPSRIRHMVREGQLPAHKFGRDWQIDAAAIEQLAHSTRRPGRPRKARTEETR